MFKKKKHEWHNGEQYPGGRQNLPFGMPATKPRTKRATRTARMPLRFPRVNWRLDRNLVEKLFLLSIFIVIEIMIWRVFFGTFESIFDAHNFPEAVRSVLKLAQLAMFIIFTYVNIMLCFFKVNIFQ
jgi:hypothetical protein